MSSHEISLADANMAEVARLHSKLIDLRAALEQKDQAILAERRARDLALADTAAYRRVLEVLSRAGDVASVRGVALAALTKLSAGAQLLAELDAARAYLDYVDNYRALGRMSDDERNLYDAAWEARTKASEQ